MLTHNQITATDHRQNLSVTANAGAGKTTVLVQRYIEILLSSDIKVGEIAAITFTEKAAGELKKKIAEGISERLQSKTEARITARLEHIRSQLVSANIGTIHSFCGQMLRDYPIEANVDASFIVLDGYDRKKLEEEAIDEIMQSLMISDIGGSWKGEWLDLLRMFGRQRIRQFLRSFLAKREQLQQISSDPGGYPSPHVNKEGNRDNDVYGEFYRSIDYDRWKRSIDEVVRESKKDSAGELIFLSSFWRDDLPEEKKAELLFKASGLLLTQTGSVRKKYAVSAEGLAKLKDQVEFLAVLWKNASPVFGSMEDAESRDGNAMLAGHVRTLLSAYRLIVEKYTEKKRVYSHLDFEDLLLHARSLMQNETVRSAMERKFKYMLVDEFQDTNRLQYEIVSSLISQFKQINLFIVGDPKQSIYGFRDADVSIFEVMKDQIIRSGNGKEVLLTESFRLLPNLIDFINRIFSKIMSGHRSVYDVRYEELMQGRRTAAEGQVELLIVESDGRKGPEEDPGRSADSLSSECRLVARRINSLVQKGEPVYYGKEEAPKPCEYRDIAILLRQRTNLTVLEKVLGDHKIPYILTGGIGYYQTQEIYDLYNYAAFLLNPEDDTALAGILRSPFYSISDELLMEVSLQSGRSFWEKFMAHAPVFNDKFVARAVKLLRSHLSLVNRLPLPSLLQRILMETGWVGTVAGVKSGDRYRANVEKLLGVARDFESKGNTMLYDFVMRLKALINNEEREGQASIDSSEDCVKVMTIHAAKGLEFPVVVIPFADQSFRTSPEPYIDQKIGITFKVKESPDDEKEISPGVHELMKWKNRLKSDAEEKRIFYVGCTRARDVLIISGKLDGKANRNTYLNWVIGTLDIRESIERHDVPKFSPSVIKVLDTTPGNERIRQILHELKLGVKYPDAAESSGTVNRIPVPGKVIKRGMKIKPLSGKPHGEFYSATQILTYLDCPVKYYLKYRLGIPEPGFLPDDFDENDETERKTGGEMVGLITHAALQSVGSSEMSDEELRGRIRNIVSTKLTVPEKQYDKVMKTVFRMVNDFIRSEIGQKILRQEPMHAEYAVNISFGRDYLTGTIDRLFRDEGGAWSIVDYKTDKLRKDNPAGRSNSHKTQLCFYSLLVSRLFNQKGVKSTLIYLDNSSFIEYQFSDADLRGFESLVRTIIESIQNEGFDKKLSHCRNCGYNLNDNCILASI